MADVSIEDFINRVNEHLPSMTRDGFTSDSWRVEGRPTNEAVGLKSGVNVDPDKMAARILDVGAYPGNVKYIESITVSEQGDDYVIFTQKLKLPVLGGLQCVLKYQDHGDVDGYRMLSWHQLDDETAALDKSDGGARTEFNLGAWKIRSDEVAYALAAAPRKSDVGSLKYKMMTKGSDATGSGVLSNFIDTMIEWSQRD